MSFGNTICIQMDRQLTRGGLGSKLPLRHGGKILVPCWKTKMGLVTLLFLFIPGAWCALCVMRDASINLL